jgi:hypothetical protein
VRGGITIGSTRIGAMFATRKLDKTKVALTAAMVLSTAVSASAASKHRGAPRHRPAIYAVRRRRSEAYAVRRHPPAAYNVIPSYGYAPTQADPNSPAMTGGGSLGYNQMLLID